MSIAEIHEDIIQTHILTRLDGQTLAAASCTSSQLQSLCSRRKLWSEICSSNWPSTGDPVVQQVISGFPSGHRSFFSDAFPSPSGHISGVTSSPETTHLISSIDLRYMDELVFCKVEPTNTVSSDWFQTSPFRIDLLEPKELVPSALKFSGDDQAVKSDLEKHMTLSWIVIDPAQNRAVNLSSRTPVSVHWNWLTGNIEVTFAVVVNAGDDRDHVNCNIEVTCEVKEGGRELNVSGVSLTIQDMDSKSLNGKDSMVILQGLTASEHRRCSGEGEERERYEEYIQRRRERKEKKERRERRLDMVCIASGVVLFMAFWSFALYY